ncbi:MAG: transposase family protein [Thermomicrobiales bacterium]
MPVTSQSLAVAFAGVPDPRRAASVTYPLAAMLALVVSAIFANHLSVLEIAEWGDRQHPEVLRMLGFADGHTPCQSTVQRLFRQLDGDALPLMVPQRPRRLGRRAWRLTARPSGGACALPARATCWPTNRSQPALTRPRPN